MPKYVVTFSHTELVEDDVTVEAETATAAEEMVIASHGDLADFQIEHVEEDES